MHEKGLGYAPAMTKALFGILASVLTAFMGYSEQAQACGCMWEGKPVPGFYRLAKIVFLGRAGQEEKRKKGFVQEFQVLFPLKGIHSNSFTRKRMADDRDCWPTYDEGEVTIVFASGSADRVRPRPPGIDAPEIQGKADIADNALSVCSGNGSMESQVYDLPDLLTAAGRKAGTPGDDVLVLAVDFSLPAGSMRDASIRVAYSKFLGKKVVAKRGPVEFVPDDHPADLAIVSAIALGPLEYVAMRVPDAIKDSHVIVLRQGNALELLKQWHECHNSRPCPE